MSKSKHTVRNVILVCLALVLVVVIGFGIWLGTSVKRVDDLLDQANDSYVSMQQSIEDQDYASAVEDAREAAATTVALQEELSGTQWDVAAHLPIAGQDVSVARTSADVSSHFASDAVVPILDAWDELSADGLTEDGKVDLGKIGDKIGQLTALVHTLQDAGAVVEDCSAQLDGLPTPHSERINTYVDSLRSALAKTQKTMDSLEDVLSFYTNIESFVNGIISPTDADSADANADDAAAAVDDSAVDGADTAEDEDHAAADVATAADATADKAA